MKIWVTLCIALTSTSAFSDWTKLTYSNDSYVYIDKSTLKSNGDIVEINQMFDFVNPRISPDNVITYRSSSGRESYNCKTLKNKTINFTWYADRMGKGKVLYEDKGHKDYGWEKITKDSLSDAVRREICK